MDTFRKFNPLLVRVVTVAVLTLVLLIPLGQVRGLIHERAAMREEAAQKVALGWGGMQLLGGPMLSIPFETESLDGKRTANTYHLLPNELRLQGTLSTQRRHVGIYPVPVYTLSVSVEAQFAAGSLRALQRTEESGSMVLWDRAMLQVIVGDAKGIREIREARWGERELTLQPLSYQMLSGIGSGIDVGALRAGEPQLFKLELELAGSEGLRLLPVGAVTEATLKSGWPDPSFSGTYAPVRYALDKKGFEAYWQVLELNRPFPQHWLGDAVDGVTLRAAGFGVDLFQSVDIYQRNERAVKYAVLFIALTFMGVFGWELAAGVRVHPMQYLLVGCALSVFYLLLLALSEHLGFGRSYAAGAAAVTALVGAYLGGTLGGTRAGMLSGLIVGGIYALLYLLVLSEQYALLLGAVLLFFVLAAIMLATRRYDWRTFERNG